MSVTKNKITVNDGAYRGTFVLKNCDGDKMVVQLKTVHDVSGPTTTMYIVRMVGDNEDGGKCVQFRSKQLKLSRDEWVRLGESGNVIECLCEEDGFARFEFVPPPDNGIDVVVRRWCIPFTGIEREDFNKLVDFFETYYKGVKKMSWRIFTFEDSINKLDVIVHRTYSLYYEMMVADSRRECDKLIINHESHALFSETFSLGVVGCHVFASLNKSDDERYNIGCVYGDRDTFVKKFNELVNHLISIGFPIIKARETDE